MRLTITNHTFNILSVGGVIGTIGRAETRSMDLTIAELEAVGRNLAALADRKAISWATTNGDLPDDAEGATVGISGGGGAPVSYSDMDDLTITEGDLNRIVLLA